jgi:hypothetical protein
MVRKIVSLLFVVLVNLAVSSVLSDLAARLAPHQWGMMPLNSSLGALDMHYSLLFYTDSGVWDPVNKKIAWVGGPGTCCANPAIYQRVSYDEASDTWSMASTPFSGSGHGYDGNALNTTTGDHYFAYWSDKRVNVWNGSSWGKLPDHPLSSSCCVGLAWFPELNNGKGGLVYVGGSGRVAWYNGSSWTSVSGATSAPWGGIEVFAQYNPVLKVVWMGGGGGGNYVNYKMDVQGKLTRMKDAPVNLKNNVSLKSCDPVSGKFLVYDMNSEQWWEYDMTADSWAQITDMTPKFSLGSGSLFHAPIPEYGVVAVFRLSSSAKYVYLYKHTASSAVEGTSVGGSNQINVVVTPNPFHGSTTIQIDCRFKIEDCRLKIFDLAGRKVADFRYADKIQWKAAGQSAGVYVARVNAGRRAFQKKLILMK